MTMVFFGNFITITCNFTIKKKNTTDEEEAAWAFESLQRSRPLQCESTRTQMLQHSTLLQISRGYWDMDAYVH